MHQVKDISFLPDRLSDSHKGDYGKVLIVGGCPGMTGAPALAGRAALRAGSGLVRVAVGKSVLPIVAAIEPCYTTIALEDEDGNIWSKAIDTVLNNLADNDAAAFGPGIGQAKGVKDILEKLIAQTGLKLVIDADGLNVLSAITNWFDINKADLILTPHPGEMKKLWASVFREEMPSDRVDLAMKFAEKTGTTLVLKGSNTVVAETEKFYVNETGNAGMATAGSGDVLTGVITSLCGQGLNNFDASVLGVYEHGVAGDRAAAASSQAHIIATDIIENLGI
jgi:ADP-dependent NAD(P)H-hydrate dehydratase